MVDVATQVNFISHLAKVLADTLKGFKIKREQKSDDQWIDLILEYQKDGRKIFIETKNVQNYDSIPLATVVELNRLKQQNPDDKIIFISFSTISKLLKDKLKEAGIDYLENPSIDQAVTSINDSINSNR